MNLANLYQKLSYFLLRITIKYIYFRHSIEINAEVSSRKWNVELAQILDRYNLNHVLCGQLAD